jgi:uncharacterized membrane protein (GlpM family)
LILFFRDSVFWRKFSVKSKLIYLFSFWFHKGVAMLRHKMNGSANLHWKMVGSCVVVAKLAFHLMT